jgi:hypothetical protein
MVVADEEAQGRHDVTALEKSIPQQSPTGTSNRKAALET